MSQQILYKENSQKINVHIIVFDLLHCINIQKKIIFDILLCATVSKVT